MKMNLNLHYTSSFDEHRADYLNRTIEAAKEYIRRCTGFSGPKGELVKGTGWTPAPEERRACCESVRPPCSHDRFTLFRHCRTQWHLARLYGVSPESVRAAMKLSEVRALWDKLGDFEKEDVPADYQR